MKSPERCFETFHDIASAFYVRRFAMPEGAGAISSISEVKGCSSQYGERANNAVIADPPLRRIHRTQNQRHPYSDRRPLPFVPHAWSANFRRIALSLLWIISKVKRNGRKPHQRPFPAVSGSVGPQYGSRRCAKTCQRGSHRHPYVKHFAVAAQMRFSKPASIAFQLIDGSNARFSIRLSARHSAIEVSSVHSPGARRTGAANEFPLVFQTFREL